MAYTQYSPDVINGFINQKGIGNDPWAMYNFRQQYNVDPAALDSARGWAAGTSQGFMDQAGKTLDGPIAGAHDLASTNPQMAYALAQRTGSTAGQADTRFGLGSGTSAAWAQQQGLTGFGAPAATGGATLGPISGTPTPAANTPNPYLSGGAAPSTTGSAPATMPATGGSGAVGVPDYMVAAGTGPGNYTRFGGANAWTDRAQREGWGSAPTGASMGSGGSYMPAGGPARFGSMGNQGMQGLADYLFQNPSTMAMGNEVTRGVMNALQRQALPAIRRGATANGTLGGSRQGIAEGLATGDAMSGLAGALANLYGNQFNQDRGYGLNSDALDFQIHQGNAATMRQGQLDQLNAMGQFAGWNQQGIGAATQARDQPFTDWNRFVGPASQMAGLGNTQTQNLQGNPYLSAIGGALAGYKMFGG